MPLARILVAFVLSALLLGGCSEPPRPTTTLYRAIQVGDLDQIKRHIYWGTDINQADPQGDNPLHAAARRGRVIIARELLKNGADPNARNQADQTPLEVALTGGKTQLAGVLIQEGATSDPQKMLFVVVRAGVDDRDSLELLTGRGADVNAKDQTGVAPLQLAVKEGNRLLTKRLIDLGADINLPDEAGRTPLSIATENGSQPIIDLLERFGARAEPVDSAH